MMFEMIQILSTPKLVRERKTGNNSQFFVREFSTLLLSEANGKTILLFLKALLAICQKKQEPNV